MPPIKPCNGNSAVAALSLHFARSTNIESRFRVAGSKPAEQIRKTSSAPALQTMKLACRRPFAEQKPASLTAPSSIAATSLVQDPRPTLVGERVNSQGSRKAKEMLLADDYDGLVQIAEDQVEGGAHVLDLCVALTERSDEDEQMREVAKRVSLSQPAVALALLAAQTTVLLTVEETEELLLTIPEMQHLAGAASSKPGRPRRAS